MAGVTQATVMQATWLARLAWGVVRLSPIVLLGIAWELVASSGLVTPFQLPP